MEGTRQALFKLLRRVNQSPGLVRHLRARPRAACLPRSRRRRHALPESTHHRCDAALQLITQGQPIAAAPPEKALQQTPLPHPALHPTLPLIPAPIHQSAAAEAMAPQHSMELLTDPRWPQPVTVLTMQAFGHRLIQHPCPGAFKGGVEPTGCAQLLHRLGATAQPWARSGTKGAASAAKRID